MFLPGSQSFLDFSTLTLLGSLGLLTGLLLTVLRRRTLIGIAQGYLLLDAFGLVLLRVLATDTILNYAFVWVLVLSGLIVYRIARYEDEP